jgi:alpha-1,3-mannosyltransferase
MQDLDGRILSLLPRPLASALCSFKVVACLLFAAELALSLLIVAKVKFTDIDWGAYVQEVEGVLVHRDYNYTNLRGGTSPGRACH